MGMNYYVQLNKCEKCKRYDEIHLGKSSGGWRFSFQYNDGKYYKNVNEMKEWLKDKIIYNECDEEISYKEFWEMVKEKQKNKIAINEKTLIDGYSFSNYEFS